MQIESRLERLESIGLYLLDDYEDDPDGVIPKLLNTAAALLFHFTQVGIVYPLISSWNPTGSYMGDPGDVNRLELSFQWNKVDGCILALLMFSVDKVTIRDAESNTCLKSYEEAENIKLDISDKLKDILNYSKHVR